MPIFALAGDVVTCSGLSLVGPSITLMGACVVVALAMTIGMDALRAKSRNPQESTRELGVAQDSTQT